MNTTPSNTPENTTSTAEPGVLVFSSTHTNFGVNSASIREDTAGRTGTVLDFKAFARKQTTNSVVPVTKRPNFIMSSDNALPEFPELSGLVEHIFSNTDHIDRIDPRKMEELQAIMHMAAKIDAMAGRFGMIGGGLHQSFSNIFKKNLNAPVKFIPDNKLLGVINTNIRAIFTHAIQEKLLSTYGKILENRNDNEDNSEQMEKNLAGLKGLKNVWKEWGLYWATNKDTRPGLSDRGPYQVIRGSIPKQLEEVLVLLFETFVEHYVEQVWEIEANIRHAPAEVVKSA